MDKYILDRQKAYRLKSNNASTKRYEKTIQGFLMRAYRNMLSRVVGVQKKNVHLYANLSILSKSDFYSWSKSNKDFQLLWERWVSSSFDRKLSPSVDRIDSSAGYEVHNMAWVTHSENSRRGSIGRWSRQKHNPTIR